MKLKEFLENSAHIPYNSSQMDLPEAYSRELRFGLDCFGFTALLSEYFPNATPILGVYGKNIVHAGTKLDELFVDAFLRMKDGLPMGEGAQFVQTYYHDSIVLGNMNTMDNAYFARVVRYGRTMNEYSYFLNDQTPKPRQTLKYKYTFLDETGRPISIVKQKSSYGEPPAIEVINEAPEKAEKLLRQKFKLGIGDIAEMFYYAGQNAQYKTRLEQFQTASEM